ncbi:MAG: porphobilinogen synthase, partial [Gemmatimonadota bacterium]
MNSGTADTPGIRCQPSASSARPRRLRRTGGVRALVRETRLACDDLICPLFVSDTVREPKPVESMPGVHQWPVDGIADRAAELRDLGIRAVLLFGVPRTKDSRGGGADASDGVVQRALRAIRRGAPELVLIADVCLCEYTDHGHCGLVGEPGPDGEPEILNDATLPRLVSTAVSQAAAGADVVAPSGMIDGAVGAIRRGLDAACFEHTGILAYSTKYASSFYGPFRDAAEGAPRFGDRRSHQMDPANSREAMREVSLDVQEGADMLMVKPALAYLDIIRQTCEQVPELPLVAYNVSGEYAMVKAACERGWVDERRIVEEILVGMKRAGADMIITYHAPDVARWLAG